MKRIDILGSINIDLSATAPHLPAPGETVAGGEIAVMLGGKGANQAIAAGQCGGAASMWGAIGESSFGLDPVAAISAAGVSTDNIKTVAGASGAALITVDAAGENCIVVTPGANAAVPEMIDATTLKGEILLSQLELAPAFVLSAFEAARARQALTVLNAAPAVPVPPALMAATDILIVNETELATYSGHQVTASTGEEDIAAAAKAISPAPKDWVIVTLGKRGAIAIGAGATITRPAPVIDVVDTTGAGDCFCGALAARLSQGATMEDAMDFAITAASLSATRRGAAPSMPTLAEVEAARD